MLKSEIDSLLEIDCKHIWHPYASMINPPKVNLAISAENVTINLADGTKLIDAVSSWWCTCHGHNHIKIVDAIAKQTKKLSQVMFAGFTHECAIHLAEKLVEVTPKGLNKVFFVDSGSVSVECAIKMALQYQATKGFKNRKSLATVRGGYHGDTFGAMSVSDPEGMSEMFAHVSNNNFFVPRPSVAFNEEWNDKAFEPMAKMLEEHSNEIAAVIIEPIFQGANAMNFYHPQYLKKLREICSEYDILLILDEVATGFGRTGKFFAQEYANIIPDIMCVGKALTGGAISLSAMIASDMVADVVSNNGAGKFMHGPTFMANPIACAAGCASLELFKSYDWQSNVKRIENVLKDNLFEVKNHPNVKDVRVLGAIGVIELKTIPTAEKQREIILSNGVWLRPFGNWLYTMPPFITTNKDLEKITNTMKIFC